MATGKKDERPNSPHEARHGGAPPHRDDPNAGLAEILAALREGSDPAAGGEDASPKTEGAAGGFSTQSGTAPPPSGTPSSDAFLLRRLDALEAELARERKNAAEARAELKARSADRGEVEAQIRAVSESLKRERESSHAQGRIEALEARLDKMHEGLASRLRENGETFAAHNAESLELLRAIPQLANQLSSDSKILAHWVFETERRLRAFEGRFSEFAERAPAVDEKLDGLAGELRALGGRVEDWVREFRGTREETTLAIAALQAALATLRIGREAGDPSDTVGEQP